MKHSVLPVVLCGGSGTRLWPLSSADRPKQLLPLVGEHTMLQDTLLRLRSLELDVAAPLIVCNERYGPLVAAQADALGDAVGNVILEPVGRNSAPAATVAALLALELLQSRPGITAEQLGERLGVTERAARRYVGILREAGIPVESTRGPYGGYRVGRGLRLPPLMFSASEALALVMAVLDGYPEARATYAEMSESLDRLEETLASARTAAQVISLPRPLVNVRPAPVTPASVRSST